MSAAASGSASGPPWGLITAGGTSGRLALDHADLREIGTELLRDIAMVDAAARPFIETADWRAAYDANAAEIWATIASALESVYQQIHKLRDALTAFVGRDWTAARRATPAYEWHLGRNGAVGQPTTRSPESSHGSIGCAGPAIALFSTGSSAE